MFIYPSGDTLIYHGPANNDYSIIKGIFFTFDFGRYQFISLAFNYTYQIAEGTSAYTDLAFKYLSIATRRIFAPLDYDQRHTGSILIDISIPEGRLGIFENTSIYILSQFASGRPYTPLATQNILYPYIKPLTQEKIALINSRRSPGRFRVDLKIEKSFEVYDNMILTPYIWIENLLDRENVVNVNGSTGEALTTG